MQPITSFFKTSPSPKKRQASPHATLNITPASKRVHLKSSLPVLRGRPSDIAKQKKTVNVCLFRNDLRTQDNPALHAACNSDRNVIAIYFWTPEVWKRHNLGPPRTDFIQRTIVNLSKQLWDGWGIPLLLPSAKTLSDQVEYISSAMSRFDVHQIYANAEYEVNESNRDQQFKDCLKDRFQVFHDQCIVPPHEIPAHLTVYNQVKNKWMAIVQEGTDRYLKCLDAPTSNDWTHWPDSESPVRPDSVPENPFPLDAMQADVPGLWPVGEREAHSRLEEFATEAIHRYAAERNSPSEDMTSKLSPYLSIGTISSRHCVCRALKAANKKPEEIASITGGSGKWIAEVIWRDFYRFIMFRHPRICKYQPFMDYGKHIEWRDSPADFDAWCQGRTGFPIVDAAMQQLLRTGYMHNRLRMLVASFLSKHLLIDWRKGEKWFSEHLVDIDLASNNGGWQWSSSVGVDPHEWIRVLSPLLQSEKIDPEGHFLRSWLPELRRGCGKNDTKDIHDPFHRRGETFVKSIGYHKPIVDHKVARERAMEAYRRAKERCKPTDQ